MRPDMHRSLVIDALEMGVYQRRPQPGGLIFPSDRGTQYASEDFRAVIEKHGMRASMTQGQLLGQRSDRDAVRVAESGTVAPHHDHELN